MRVSMEIGNFLFQKYRSLEIIVSAIKSPFNTTLVCQIDPVVLLKKLILFLPSKWLQSSSFTIPDIIATQFAMDGLYSLSKCTEESVHRAFSSIRGLIPELLVLCRNPGLEPNMV